MARPSLSLYPQRKILFMSERGAKWQSEGESNP